jgi:hypothetical protein
MKVAERPRVAGASGPPAGVPPTLLDREQEIPMMSHPRSLVVVLLAAGGCATGGSAGGGGAGSALAYGLPEGGSVSYVHADTVAVAVDAGGQTIDVDQTSVGTLDMTFRPSGAAIEVSAVYSALDAQASNPMQGTQRATAGDVKGPIVFTLSQTGEATLVTAPELTGAAPQLLDIGSLAGTFFPRLPARAVQPGDAWTDTVHVESDRPDGQIISHSIVAYTVAGDTVVSGRPLLKVTFVSQDERSADVTQQGMDMSQDVSGTMRGHFLWDRSRGILHSQTQSGVFTGTMEVSAAPFPLGLAIEARSVIRLVEGG